MPDQYADQLPELSVVQATAVLYCEYGDVDYHVTMATLRSGLQPLDADLTQLAAISGVRGDVIYYGASGWTRLAAGTAGHVLQTGGAGADPSWTAQTGGGGSMVYPGAGIAVSTGSAWGTSLAVGTTSGTVAAGDHTHATYTLSAVVPSTAPSAGQVLVGNAGGTAYAPATLSGSGATFTLSSSGVLAVSAIANASLANSSVTVTAGTGLTGGGAVALGGSVSLSVSYGTTSGTACQGNDARLSDSRAASSVSTSTTTAISGLLKGATTLAAASAGTDYVAPGGALGTPASGTMTNCTGLPPAGITLSATDRLVGRSTAGGGAGEEITCTAAGRALLDDATAAAQLTTLAAPRTVNGGRLSAVDGVSLYAPLPATPSSTDTTADTVAFAAAHGWVTGTQVTPAATAGGLTAGTFYYARAVDAATVSFHATRADAANNASKINLTAGIGLLLPRGVQSTSVYWTPHAHGQISLPTDGNAGNWTTVIPGTVSLALGTLTSGALYDVFGYLNAGTLALELSAAWASATARTDALATLDGQLVKSGAATRLYLGTLRMVSTTETENTQGKRLLWNWYNREPLPLFVQEYATSWTMSGTVNQARQVNGNAANQVEVVAGLPGMAALSLAVSSVAQHTSVVANAVSIGEDTTTTSSVPDLQCAINQNILVGSPQSSGAASATLAKAVPLGYHVYMWLECAGAAITYYGPNAPFRRPCLSGSILG